MNRLRDKDERGGGSETGARHARATLREADPQINKSLSTHICASGPHRASTGSSQPLIH
jgi:hypothetical protein